MAFHTPTKKNVHVFTDNIVRKVSSGKICPRFLRTFLSSNIDDILTIQKADRFPSFSTEHYQGSEVHENTFFFKSSKHMQTYESLRNRMS